MVLCTIVFTFSLFTGYSLGDVTAPESFEDALSNIPDPREATFLEMFTAILSNNVIASFMFMATGVFAGIPPLIFMAFNGFFIGYISWNATQAQGILFVLTTLLPHGVIEIPAILLSASMGMGLGYQVLHRLWKRKGLVKYVSSSISLFIKRIIPMLVLAAVIETALIYFYVI